MRKILITLLCCTIVLLAGYVGVRAYRSWKQEHLLSLAREFAVKGDLRNAMLSASGVLRANPRNIEACRFMAVMAETNNSPDTVIWRSRVLELAPNSMEDRLALVRAAFLHNDLLTATNTLAGVTDAATNTLNYHLLAGLVAVATRQIPQAETHFLAASQIQPTNLVPQLNLAVLRLNDTNALVQSEARIALQKLAADPTLRSQALRELIADAQRQNNTNDALALAAQLVQPTNASFADRIVHLTVLQALHNEELTSALASCQKAAADDPAKINQLATWQAAAQGPGKALSWLETLPTQVQSNRTVQMTESECRVDLQDWRELQATLPQQNWAELEFVRHAFLARALRGLDLKSSADTEWALAVKATDNHKESLAMLLRLAGLWKWQSEGEELLWIFVNRYPEEKWAYTTLETALYVSGRTRSFMSLCEQQTKRDPSDLDAKNNLAMTALLLNAQEIKPHNMARELYEQHATNSTIISTYAFSLHLQKKDSEALRIMRQLKPQDLNRPAVSGYYGLFLEAVGSNQLAEPYLTWASRATLLPEERTLFAEAKARLAKGN
jgi:hypothetical protein